MTIEVHETTLKSGEPSERSGFPWWDTLAILFLSAVIVGFSGQFSRVPIDDEDFTLTMIRTRDLLGIIKFCFLIQGDIHPPLSYLIYAVTWKLFPSLFGLRLVAWACTMGAVLLWHRMTMRFLEKITLENRCLAVFLFSTAPMLFSIGATVRWYPPLALFSALAVYLIITENCTPWVGIPLGLAVSTNFLAFLLFGCLPVLFWLFPRKTTVKEFFFGVVLFGLSGGLGLYTWFQVISQHQSSMHSQFAWKLIEPFSVNFLGFFGGYSLGISQSWLVGIFLPIAAFLCLFGLRESPEPRRSFRLATLFFCAWYFSLSFLGFSKPRSFLLLAPALSSLFFWGWLEVWERRMTRVAIVLCAVFLSLPMGVVANLRSNPTPFKRTLSVPYEHLFSFIEENAQGKTLILSTDYPVITNYQVFNPGRFDVLHVESISSHPVSLSNYRTVFFVEGFSHQVTNWFLKSDVWQRFFEGLCQGREEKAKCDFGLDEDAGLKKYLTKEDLSRVVLRVRLFR